MDSAKAEFVFPLASFYFVYHKLVGQIQKLWGTDKSLWHGFKVLAIDKTTLMLPEWPELAKKFGWHKTSKGVGTVAVEMACLFCARSRAPIAYVFDKANTSEFKLFGKLFNKIRSHAIILIDNGFYSFKLFKRIRTSLTRHFLIPAATNLRPKVIEKLGPGEYLAEISNSKNKEEKMKVRIIYVHRKGFRRRRLVTSLLDTTLYPASAIAALYHERWTIETFYGEFKTVMKANQWHCQTVDNFEKELACQMIVTCLTKLAMSEAAKLKSTTPGKISFSKAYTEVGCLFKKVLRHAGLNIGTWEADFKELIKQCARHLVKVKPGRFYERDTQKRRRKSRGLEKGRVGRPPKNIKVDKKARAEVHTPVNGHAVLLD